MHEAVYFLNDPGQHALESQSLEVENGLVTGTVGELRVMNPNPQVSQDQGDRHEEQPDLFQRKWDILEFVTRDGLCGFQG